jgi:hypothetical protein
MNRGFGAALGRSVRRRSEDIDAGAGNSGAVDWHLWYLLGRIVFGAGGLFVFFRYLLPLAARRAWNREDRRAGFDALVGVIVAGFDRDIPPAAIVDRTVDTAQDLGPDRAPFAKDTWACTIAKARDVYVQFSMDVAAFGYMVSAQAGGPWQSLEHLIDESVGGVVDRDDSNIQYLVSCAKLHVENWDVVHAALVKSTVSA